MRIKQAAMLATIALISYAVFGFILWDFNIYSWGPGGRALLLAWIIVIVVLLELANQARGVTNE